MIITFGPNEPPYAALRPAKRDDGYKGAASGMPRLSQFFFFGDPTHLCLQWIFIAAFSL